jgi:hypothetical protein
MPEQNWREWFEQAWAFREESLYPSLFGSLGNGIYPLDADLFATIFGQDSIDPRWLTHGVFECPPTAGRLSWLYVSSGLSNAWEADSPTPEAVSGLGCEFLFESCEQSRWALIFMQRMVAFQQLLAANRFPGKPPLHLWDRIPLRSPIDGSASALTWILVTPSVAFGGTRQLPSGCFEFLQFVAITEDEAGYARRHGGNELLELLVSRNAAPVADANRRTILSVSAE